MLVERDSYERDTSQPVSALHDVGQRDVAYIGVAGDAWHHHRAQLLVVMATVATIAIVAATYSCGTRKHVDVYRRTVSQ